MPLDCLRRRKWRFQSPAANHFSLCCRRCDVSSSDLLDGPLVMPPLLPYSVRDESFLDATCVPATMMGEETRTCSVVSPKAAGDRQSAPCQKAGSVAAWQALEKEEFLKRAAALGRKGESTVGIVGGGTSIQGSPLNRETVGSNIGLTSAHFVWGRSLKNA